MLAEKRRVLFVDDEPAVTHGLSVALRKGPWDIVTADSGEEALERVSESPFDVVVSDERMPGLQGSDFLSIVRRDHPETIRIILSGQANLPAAIKAINAAEIYRFLLKPCPAEEVGLTIREALKQRDERRSFEAWRERHRGPDRGQVETNFEGWLDSLWMGFQPIVRAADATVLGYEALARNDNPEVAHPGALFAAADELGRSLELGARIREGVARRVCEAPENAIVFVNVNPDHLADPGLYAKDSPLAAHAERVVLEVTERESLGSGDELQDQVARLRDLGYRIAIDDLGAGYAGLTSFTRITPEFVKLDMELIQNIDRSPTKQEVVRYMSQICRSLGIASIAEGIETVEEWDTVLDLGCGFLQGFLFGKADRRFLPCRPKPCRGAVA